MKQPIIYMIFCFTICFINCQSVIAISSGPLTLSYLIEKSSYIVVASIDNPHDIDINTLDSIESQNYSDNYFNDNVLISLNVQEVLKGENKNRKQITVSYSTIVICPSPPYYPDKKTVLAFLDNYDDQPIYYTVGMASGCNIINDIKQLDIYKKFIFDYLEILKIKEEAEFNNQYFEWIVKCGENELMRKEFVNELIHFDYYYDNNYLEIGKPFGKYLTDSHKHRLETTLLSIDTLEYEDLYLSAFVSQSNYPKLNSQLIDNLQFAQPKVHHSEIMTLICSINPDQELKEIYNVLIKIDERDSEKDIKRKLLIEKFIEVASKY